MTPFINTAYNKFQTLINPKDDYLPPLKNLAESAVKFHGELKSRLVQYLNPKSIDLCSKLAHAIPMTLILNTLSAPQILVVSVISGACLWSCKKEYLSKDSKVNLLHSMAIVFFANIISYSTEFSLSFLIRLPINAALFAGSLFLADRLESETKPEIKLPEAIELPDLTELQKNIEENLINHLTTT